MDSSIDEDQPAASGTNSSTDSFIFLRATRHSSQRLEEHELLIIEDFEMWSDS